MSSDEDDFMSDKFLHEVASTAGLSTSYAHRRQLQIEKNRLEAENMQRKMYKPKHIIEKERRDEALAKPVSVDSKGFKLLEKMGFKPGMSLGKKKDENDQGSGIIEPVSLDLKVDRKGLGHQAHMEDQSKQRIQETMNRMRMRAKVADALAQDYRKRKRVGSTQKQLIIDLIRCQKACVELDLRNQVDQPAIDWFWPAYKKKQRESDDSSNVVNDIKTEDEKEEFKYIYTNGQPAPKEVRFNELLDNDLEERLESITLYLRSTHHYCVWCGCHFENEEQLSDQCPGNSRQQHDGDDGD